MDGKGRRKRGRYLKVNFYGKSKNAPVFTEKFQTYKPELGGIHVDSLEYIYIYIVGKEEGIKDFR